jgi:HEAT repeat protein
VIVGWLPVAVRSADPPSETRYDGRTLAEWRERIQRLDYQSADIGLEVPGLLAIAEDTQAPWFTRRQAALTLGRIGVPAQSAIPELVKLLDEQATDPEQSTQLWVMKALALFGPLAAETAPQLVAFLEDPERAPLPRLASIEALGRIGPGEPAVLPAITRAIDAGLRPAVDADTLERAVAAAEMLELFRGHAAPATPSLIRATASDDVLLRRAAANTLGLIGPAAEPAVPALADLVLFDDSHEVRDLAARSLGRIGASAEPVLVQMLEDPEVDVKSRAAFACRELSGAAPETVRALQQAITNSEPGVRIAALESLWAIAPEPKTAIPAAIAELSNGDRDIRMRAVRLLESTGPQIADWLPELEALAQSGSGPASQAAGRVIRTLASRTEE